MYYFNIFLNKKYFKKINNNRIPALNHLSKPDQLNTKKKEMIFVLIKMIYKN
jgi:hypothetical protein